ncbi:hypothetical protein [Microbacterium sp. cf332]|uniref:hypothetical protein n=1 Tax=Microbacterium sp. cf332 TaxID=1761804 RepID=UPI000890E9FD|nr:hypothetical protein [Microbacterium sp. cf332]SDQ06829.1 hypothetical protein SAMN04487847_0159 [Microbacterium sp. cf332]
MRNSARTRSLRRAVVGIPPTATIALVYLLSRAVTTLFLVIAAELSGPESRFGADATLGSLTMGWDAQWYWLIAYSGYPTELPLDAAGNVAENAWAFMPVYPAVADALGRLVGGFPVAAPLVSAAAGYLACLVLFALLRARIGRVAAMWAVVFFSTAGPMAALFQLGYAESLFLLWLLLALFAVDRRRWWWLYLWIPLLAFTRPGVLAFALMLALYGVWRWVRRRREPLAGSEIAHIVAAGLLAAACGFAWPVITGIVTGDPGAYLHTELAWRRAWVGDHGGFVPFDGTVRATLLWSGIWGIPVWVGLAGLAMIVVAVTLALVAGRRVRRLGMPIRLWSAAYLIYLLAVFFPQSSTFRLLVPLSPLWGAVAASRSWAWRSGVLIVGLVAQWWWIHEMYAVGSTFAQIP